MILRAILGAWPWMALLFYVYGVIFTKPEYECGKINISKNNDDTRNDLDIRNFIQNVIFHPINDTI